MLSGSLVYLDIIKRVPINIGTPKLVFPVAQFFENQF